MKLSEAILLGSVGTKQAFGSLRTTDGATCALGAAMVGSGWDEDEMTEITTYAHLSDKFPITKKFVPLPYSDNFVGGIHPLGIIIPYLNDKCKWTRPQIAAWVATIEDQLEQETQQQSCQSEHTMVR